MPGRFFLPEEHPLADFLHSFCLSSSVGYIAHWLRRQVGVQGRAGAVSAEGEGGCAGEGQRGGEVVGARGRVSAEGGFGDSCCRNSRWRLEAASARAVGARGTGQLP